MGGRRVRVRVRVRERARVRRSVYIEDYLLTVSDYGVKVNELTDPSNEFRSVLFYPAD